MATSVAKADVPEVVSAQEEARRNVAMNQSVSPWVAVGALALVGGVLPIALAWRFGALGIPRNDDWAYILSAFGFADSGQITGHGWAGMNLVGQLVLSLPVVWLFGHRIAALQVEVALLGVVGLVAVFDLAKRLLAPRRALFVALMVAVGPMWASLSASYLTDVPAFALAMTCLALGVRALRGDDVHVPVFWAAVLIGFVAFTIREYAIVAPLAVCVTALWMPRRRLVGAVSALGGLVALAAIFVLWRRGLSDFRSVTPKRATLHSVKAASLTSARSVVLVGLLVSPAVLLAGPKRLLRAASSRAPRTSVVLAVVALLGLGGEVAAQRASAGLLGPGNYVVPNGILGTTTVSGTRPDLLPRFVLVLVASVGVLTAALVVLAALPPLFDAVARIRGHRLGTPTSPALAIVALAVIGYGLATAVPALFRVSAWDRYLLPLIPLVGILVLRSSASPANGRSHGRARCASAALLALAALGLIFATNSASFDGTKWRVATRIATAGTSPTRIDGGFEWTDYHAGQEIFLDPNRARRAHNFCIVLRAEPHRPHRSGQLRAASVWSPTGTQLWIVAEQQQPC